MPGTLRALRPCTSPLDQGYQLHVRCVRPNKQQNVKSKRKLSSSPHAPSLNRVKPSIFSRKPTRSRLTIRFTSHPLLCPGESFCAGVVSPHAHRVVFPCEYQFRVSLTYDFTFCPCGPDGYEEQVDHQPQPGPGGAGGH